MKITILGGGGVRTPLFVKALIRKAPMLDIKELWLQDVDPERLAGIGLVVDGQIAQGGASFPVTKTASAEAAIEGSDFILSTIRVGVEGGRVLDERIPLALGVLGQETTGPGGMAMALRTIPVMLDYARLIEQKAPEAWLINFTNPVGIITQALKRHTKIKVVGICDSATALCRGSAKVLGVPPDALDYTYGGLNHLGWLFGLRHQGQDVYGRLLARLSSGSNTQAIFGFAHDLIRILGLVPNEYLYYYYHTREAVEHILAAAQTRGEQVRDLNRTLYRALDARGGLDAAAALERYQSYMDSRVSTYMQTETAGTKVEETPAEDEIGYEGMALAIIEAVAQGADRVLIVDTDNGNALSDLARDDVVEVPCLVGRGGVRPIAQGALPLAVRGLVQQVKAFELQTIEATLDGDADKAVKALAIHPLVPSFDLAREIVGRYLEAHRQWLPQFTR